MCDEESLELPDLVEESVPSCIANHVYDDCVSIVLQLSGGFSCRGHFSRFLSRYDWDAHSEAVVAREDLKDDSDDDDEDEMDDIREQAAALPTQSDNADEAVPFVTVSPEQVELVLKIAKSAKIRKRSSSTEGGENCKKNCVLTKNAIIGGRLHKQVGKHIPRAPPAQTENGITVNPAAATV